MAALPVVFPLPGLAFDWNTETLDIPNAHAFNNYFGILGTPNVPAGTRDYPIISLQALGFALSIRNPNNPNELDNCFLWFAGLGHPRHPFGLCPSY